MQGGGFCKKQKTKSHLTDVLICALNYRRTTKLAKKCRF